MGAKHLATGAESQRAIGELLENHDFTARNGTVSTNSHESKAKLKIAEYHE